MPVAVLCGLHYSEISDLAWSEDGSHLVVSSRDGYCSIVRFDPGDLGFPLDKCQLMESNTQAAERLPLLEEIRQRCDALPVKKQIRPPVAAKQGIPEDMAVQENADQRPVKMVPAKRRIRPMAVDVNEADVPVPLTKSTELHVPQQTKTHRLTDLQKLADGAQTSPDQPSEGQTSVEGQQKKLDSQEQETKPASFMDLLAMTQTYARDRFGSNT